MGAPTGNQNARKSRLFEQALVREIKQRDLKDGEGETLRKIAAALVDRAIAQDLVAIKETRDTLDGKPTQQTEISGPDGGAIEQALTVQFVDAGGVSEQA
jgi:hypothetical protein